jgi:hypothetical protein
VYQGVRAFALFGNFADQAAFGRNAEPGSAPLINGAVTFIASRLVEIHWPTSQDGSVQALCGDLRGVMRVGLIKVFR